MAAREHHETRATDLRREELGERGRREDVVLADQHERRHADPAQPVHAGAVPGEEAPRLPLDRLGLGLVRIGEGPLEGLLDIFLLGQERRGEDPRIEHVAESLLDGDAVGERHPRLDRVEEPRVPVRPRAREGQRADEPRVAKRQLHRDRAPHGGADDVGARNREVLEQRRGVVGHLGRGVNGLGRQIGLPDSAVVEGDHLEVGREGLGLEGPVHGRRREAVDHQHGRPLPAHLVVDADLVDDREGHQITRATLMEPGSA